MKLKELTLNDFVKICDDSKNNCKDNIRKGCKVCPLMNLSSCITYLNLSEYIKKELNKEIREEV